MVMTIGSSRFVVPRPQLVVRAVLWPRAPACAPGQENSMQLMIAPRHASLAMILFACGLMGSAWAADPPPAQVATPANQKGCAGQAHRMSSASEQHRLPPDSSTKHTLELPGRTLSRRDRRLHSPVRRQGRAAGRHRLYLPTSVRGEGRPVPVSRRGGGRYLCRATAGLILVAGLGGRRPAEHALPKRKLCLMLRDNRIQQSSRTRQSSRQSSIARRCQSLS
ncbi:hypothetical protein ACVIYL_004369 [Bradyrhizobium sp. USDA 3315]